MGFGLILVLIIISTFIFKVLLIVSEKAKHDRVLFYLALSMLLPSMLLSAWYLRSFGINSSNLNFDTWVNVATFFNNAFSPILLVATIVLLYATWRSSERELSMMRALTLSNEILNRLENICEKVKQRLESEQLEPLDGFHIVKNRLKNKFKTHANKLKNTPNEEVQRILKSLSLTPSNLRECIEREDVNTQGKNKGFSYENINHLNDLNHAIRNEMKKEAMFHTSRNRYFFIVLESLAENCEQLQSLDKLNNENSDYLSSGYRAIRLALGDKLLMFLYNYYKESIDIKNEGSNHLLKGSQGNIEKHLKNLTENLETSATKTM
ncbi:hypothetical protein HG263_06910 [Pseudoalteromonas sp. JBTF-M23]|uniref:Phage abortive infection protein n=1 Tax=Pseudoalteromonas caenipelagi TaxID=2726988 RepID=A0A849VEZ0_9GAMM|nr:hypothetical protein [Pseudoalteromonas caenipelagi]NOU50271.1 hypothetical protein [Pseudoalteromonas caenipelagi]